MNENELNELANTMTVKELRDNSLKYMSALVKKLTEMTESYNPNRQQSILRIIATIHMAAKHLTNATKDLIDMEKKNND